MGKLTASDHQSDSERDFSSGNSSEFIPEVNFSWEHTISTRNYKLVG